MEYEARSGAVYELAEMDDALLSKQEAVDRASDMHERAKACWEFLKAALPDGALKSELGTDEQRRASVPRTFILYQLVKAEYWREYNEARLSDMQEQLSQLDGLKGMLDTMSRVNGMAGEQRRSRQAFRMA